MAIKIDKKSCLVHVCDRNNPDSNHTHSSVCWLKRKNGTRGRAGISTCANTCAQFLFLFFHTTPVSDRFVPVHFSLKLSSKWERGGHVKERRTAWTQQASAASRLGLQLHLVIHDEGETFHDAGKTVLWNRMSIED